MKLLIVISILMSQLCYSQEQATLKEKQTSNFTTAIPTEKNEQVEQINLSLTNSMELKVYNPLELTLNCNSEESEQEFLPKEANLIGSEKKQYTNVIVEEMEN